MPRTKVVDGLSVAELQALVAKKKKKLALLAKERKQLVGKLAKLDAQIAAVSGAKGALALTPTARARNTKSLPDLLIEVLGGNKPMKVGEILDAVLEKGYQSASSNFRSLVNQTLIKDKRFTAVARGTYTLKK